MSAEVSSNTTTDRLDPADAATSPGLPDGQTPSSESSRPANGSVVSGNVLEATSLSPSLSFTHNPPPVPPTTKQRNHAPGIPDRRKSVRPSGSRGKLKSGRRSVIPGSVKSMADLGKGMKGTDEEVETPGESGDTFEDAVDTPRESAPTDLGINSAGTDENKGDDDDTPKMASRMSRIGNDDMMYAHGESQTPPVVEATSPDGTNMVPAEAPGAFPSGSAAPAKPNPRLSQGLMSPPLVPGHGRQRSVSPGRFPVAVPDQNGDSRRLSTQQTTSGRQSPVKGLSGDMPAVNYPPPPSTTERSANTMGPPTLDRKVSSGPMSPPPQPGNLARKASSGFGALLGRMGSIRKARSPPAPRQESKFGLERRNTGNSMVSLDVNGTPGTTPLFAIADGPEDGRQSLQERFRTLRREEEQRHEGVIWQHDENGEDSESRKNSTADSPTSPVDESVDTRHGRSGSASAVKSPPLNHSLPPGTASGLTAGPAADSAPVNWDLWQSVVEEGPAAVARTSGAELAQAIASGIPPAIRGVVWQVLAESKSDDLEALYKTLKARGTDAEIRPALSRGDSSYFGANGTEKEVASSGSSVHSDSSTPATSNVASVSPPPSIDGTSAELKGKLLAEKTKRDAAALTKLEKAIKRDLGSRTSYSKYAQSAGLQDGLFGVCKAYALFDDAVGYAQGINFITMPLLFNMSEEEAFTLLVRLMHKYNLRSLFEPEMPGLHLRLYQFERLLEDLEPALYVHLRRRNVGPQLYATQWFLTLFAYRFPLQLVLRVYDLVFSEGLTAILKFGIVLMQRNKATLMEMKDMAQLTTFLKEKLFDVYIDKSPSASSLLDSGFFGSVSGGADKELYRADEMVRDASSVIINDETLATYTAEWEESQRLTKETALELETLRSSNSLLTSKVKNLEDRVQAHDTEHVGIASDLVRLKVENDELADENEGLKLQVEELKKVVDAQPAEVEERLQAEMERIMTRNIEVQNENRAVKEEMDEMEQALVQVKMIHAQTQSDYDALKQRWSSVQSMLNNGK